MSSIFLKRPRRIHEEDEDELIRFQEEFLRQKAVDDKCAPAAKVVRHQTVGETTSEAASTTTQTTTTSHIELDDDNQILRAVLTEIIEKPTNRSQILNGDHVNGGVSVPPAIQAIKHKKLSNASSESKRANGNPSSKPTKSLFAQHLERQGRLVAHYPLEKANATQQHSDSSRKSERHDATTVSTAAARQSQHQLITGEGLGPLAAKEAERIHQENTELLAKMSADEIRVEQQKLLGQLDPKLIAFIRRRGAADGNKLCATPAAAIVANDQQRSGGAESIDEQQAAEAAEKLLADALPIDKKWLRMAKIEYEKLEWMIGCKKSKAPTATNAPTDHLDANESEGAIAARFDFAGKLMMPTMTTSADSMSVVSVTTEAASSSALHHHGADPDAAGYTIDELFHLARSTNNQQRVLALRTLANIIANCQRGLYAQSIRSGCVADSATKRAAPGSVDEEAAAAAADDANNLLNQLIGGGVLFLLRICLDDQTESVVSVSLEALKNILNPPGQEWALGYAHDWLHGGHQVSCLHPFGSYFDESASPASASATGTGTGAGAGAGAVANPLSDERKPLSAMTDDEYVRHDLVKGLVRMSLLERLAYLLRHYRAEHAAHQIATNALLIVTRCARHSPQLCAHLVDAHEPLLHAFVRDHLAPALQAAVAAAAIEPLDHAAQSTTTQIVQRAELVLRLFAVLASASATIAKRLSRSYDLATHCINWIAILNNSSGSSSSSSSEHVLAVQTQAVRLVKILVLLDDDDNDSDDHDSSCFSADRFFKNAYAILLQRVGQLSAFVATGNDQRQTTTTSAVHTQRSLQLQAIVCLFGCWLSRDKATRNALNKLDMCSNVFVHVFELIRKQLSGLTAPSSASSELSELSESSELQLQLIAVCLHFAADFAERCGAAAYLASLSRTTRFGCSTELTPLSDLIGSVVRPILGGERASLAHLRLNSALMSRLAVHSSLAPSGRLAACLQATRANNLTYLPTMLDAHDMTDLSAAGDTDSTALSATGSRWLRDTPFPLLTAFVRLATLSFSRDRTHASAAVQANAAVSTVVDAQLIRRFLGNDYLASYLRLLTTSSATPLSNPPSYLLAKQERLFVYHCVRLAFLLFDAENDSSQEDKEQHRETGQLKRTFYALALQLITQCQRGEELYVRELLEHCLFQSAFWRDYLQAAARPQLPADPAASAAATRHRHDDPNCLWKYFDKLNLASNTGSDTTAQQSTDETAAAPAQIELSYLSSSAPGNQAAETIRLSAGYLSNTLEAVHIYESLAQIKLTYLDAVAVASSSCAGGAGERRLQHSMRLNGNAPAQPTTAKYKSSATASLFVSATFSNRCLLGADWFFAPIMRQLDEMRQAHKSGDTSEAPPVSSSLSSSLSSARTVATVSSALKFVYLLEAYCDAHLEARVPVTLRYVRLLSVYLFEPDVFLDRQVVTYLFLVYFKYARDEARHPLQSLELARPIDGLLSFYDLYQHLLGQYEAASFGDYVFALYLSAPLQHCYAPRFRQLFWSDFHATLRFMRFDTHATQLLVPLRHFVQPTEKSLNLIRLYSQIVLDRADFELIARSRLAYAVVVSQLNAFIFEQDATERADRRKVHFEFKKLLLAAFLGLNNQKLKHDLIHFKWFNKNDESMEFYEELPQSRKQWLEELHQQSSNSISG